MFSLIARFLPSLAGGLGSLFNPWLIAIGLAAIGSSFFYGMHVESKSHDAYVAKAEAISAIANAKNAQRVTDSARNRKEADERHTTRISRLNTQLDRVFDLRAPPSGDRVSTISAPPAGRDGRACVETAVLGRGVAGAARVLQSELDASDKLLQQGARRIVERGSKAELNFETCQAWVVKEYRATAPR